MKKITLLFVLLFVGFSTFAQTTYNLNWNMGAMTTPADLTIEVGDQVIWTFTDTAPHSVTSDPGSTETFDSTILPAGSTYSHTFTVAGSNPYHCSAHTGMTGTITVNAVPSSMLNQSANWPNPSWTVTGTYTATGFLSNPTTTANFSFDDDVAGNGSDDSIAAESPVIDLTAAHTAGETWISINVNYVYESLGASEILEFQYYNADNSSWVSWENQDLPSNNGNGGGCSETKSNYWLAHLDISGFTPTQLSGFKYRIFFDDDPAGSDWIWGFCFDSPIISSEAPPTCLVPSALTATNILPTSADLGWTENGTATMWDIEYGPMGFVQGTGTTIADTGTVVINISGLSSNTTYDFYVRADCGATNGVSNWAGPASFITSLSCTDTFYDTGGSAGNYSSNENETWTAFPTVPGEVVTATFISFDTETDYDALYVYDGPDATSPIIASANPATSSGFPAGGYYGATVPGPFTSTHASGALTFVFMSDGGVNNPGWEANITCALPPSCTDPTVLTATNILATSADLGWTENNAPPVNMWDVLVVPAGDPTPTPTTTPTDAGVMANPYNKTGLTANTAYDFYVRADCGGATSSWAGPFAFTTACPPIVAPYVENFVGSSTPNCWIESGDNSWDYSTNGDYIAATAGDHTYGGGTNYAWMDGSDNGDGEISVLTSPLIDISGLTNPALEFHIFSFNTNDAAANMTKVEFYDGANWTIILNVGWLGPQWQYFLYDLSTFNITGDVRLRITVTGTANGGDTFNHDVLLDDVAFVELPTCKKPTNLQANNITGTSADLGWTDNNGAGLWDIEIGPAGFTPTGTPTATGVTNPYNATGLTQLTDYDFYVRTDCGGGDLSSWEGPFTFTTPCAAYTLPFVETFDDSDTPTCWTESGDNSWDFSLSAGYAASAILDHTIGGGTDYAWMDGSDNDNGEISTLTSPLVDVSSLTTPALKFYLFSNNTDDTAINIVDVEFYDGAAWNNVLNLTTLLGTDWVRYVIDLSGYTITGDVQVRFTVTSNPNGGDSQHNDILLDDVSFLEMPTCLHPLALTVAGITDTTADLGWTPGGSEILWNVEIVPAGTTPSGTPTATGVANPYTAPGLSPATDYEFYVQADCGGGDLSTFYGPYAFTTLCPTAFVPAYSEDFTNDVAPICWEEAGSGTPATGPSGTSGSWIQDEFLNTGTNQSARNNFAFSSDEEWLISPSIDLSGGSYELVYKAAITEEGGSNPPPVPGMGSDDEVQVLISPDNGTTWVNLLTYNAANYPSHLGDLEIIDLSAHTGVVKFAFWANEGSTSDDDYDFFIDDFKVRLIPACSQPTNLAATGITTTTADLSWTENNTPPATLWDVHIVPVDDPAPTSTTVPSDAGVANPYNKTGLTDGTAYEFYVRADCGGGTSFWTGPFAFATLCLNATIPYTEDFSSGTFPVCWSTTAAADSPIVASCGTNSNVLQFKNGVDVTTGLIDGTTSTTGLKVSYTIGEDVCGGAAEAIFEVEYWDGTAWVVAKSYDPVSGSPFDQAYINDSFIVPQSDVTTGFQVRFDDGDDSTADDWSIDDLVVEAAPNCLAPSNLTATGITDTSADLGWTDSNGASLWDIELGLAGFVATGTPTAIGVANPYNATGLTPVTNYEFYVRADCGGGTTSAWAGPFAFTTACTSFIAPYTEGFSTSSIPNCWSQGAANSEDWIFATNGGHVGNAGDFLGTTSASGGGLVYVDDSTPDNLGTTLVTPLVDVSGLTTPALSFYTISDNEGSTNVSFSVDFYDGANWNTGVYTSNTNTGGWIKVFIDLSVYTITGPVQARFIVDEDNPSGNFNDDRAIDDVSFDELPTCLQPTALTATGITATTADLGWTPGGSEILWNIEIVPAGTTPSGTPTAIGVANPYNATSLTSGTNYEFYVQADCGGGDLSTWAGPFAFSTPPSCGDKFYDTGGATGDYSNNENVTTTIHPVNPGDVVTVTFTAFNTEANWDALYVYDGPDATYPLIDSGLTMSAFSSFPDGGYYGTTIPGPFTSTDPTGALTFVFMSDGSSIRSGWEVDVTCAPSCPAPTGLVANQVSHNSADIIWTAGGTETEWEIEYGPTGFAPGSGTIIADNDGTLGETISGLSLATTYDVYVTAICGPGDESVQVGPLTFTTAATPPCFEVTNITVTAISDVSATISWTAGGTETEWEIEYGPTGFTLGSGTIVADNDGTLGEILTGLNPNTGYDVYVTAICGPGDESAATGPFNFTTLVSCPDVTNITVTAINDVSATVSWTAGGTETEWEIEYGPTGFTIGSGTVVADNDGTLGEILSGVLTANTAYDLYVTAICGPGDESNPVGPVNFTTLVSCPDVSNITFSNFTDVSVDVLWTAGGAETEWEIEYGPTGFAPGSGTIVVDNDGILGETLSGLTPNTGYDVYVTAICSNNQSGQVGPANFTTFATCFEVSAITASNITSITADIFWTAGGSETEWEIEFGLQGFAPGSGTLIVDNDGSLGLILTGLAPSTCYDVYVTAICAQNQSAQVGPLTFCTLPVPPACGGKFYDTGGPNSNFQNDEDYMTDIFPDVAGDAVTATFTFVNNTSFDVLIVDTGDGTPEIVPEIAAGDPPVAYTSVATDGSLHFHFVSSSAVTNPGWEADITCNPLGVNEQLFKDFSYYPNPVSGTLSLKASQEIQQVVVYDLLGQEVLKNTPDSLTPTLDFHNLQTGTYLMKVTINETVGIYRIIKE